MLTLKYRFGVATRLFLGSSLLVMLTLTACLTGIVALSRLGNSVAHLATVELPVIDKVTELARQSYAIVAQTPSLVNATTQSNRRTQTIQIEDRSELFERMVHQLGGAGPAPEDLESMLHSKDELTAQMRRIDGLLEQRLAHGGLRMGMVQHILKIRSRLVTLDQDLLRPIEQELSDLLDGPGIAPAQIDRMSRLRRDEMAIRRWRALMDQALLDMLTAAGDLHHTRLAERRNQVARTLDEAWDALSGLSGPVLDRMVSILEDTAEVADADINIFSIRAEELDLHNALRGTLAVTEGASIAFTVDVARIVQRLRDHVLASSAELHARISSTYYLFVIMAFGSVLGVGMILVYVHRGVIRRLRDLQECMRARAEGVAAPITVAGRDEIADMAASVHYFVRTIEEREQALRAATERAERANIAKTHFFAGASHDLRQPLTAMNLLLGVLQATCRDERQRLTLDKVQASLDAMIELFNSLLDVAKFELGEVAPHPEPVDAASLLARIENDFQMTAHNKGLELRVVPSTAMLWSDRLLLERMVRNLVANAIKYTASGRVLVGIRRRGVMARIEVLDTGPGIPDEALNHIFEEFYQVHNPARRRADGHGLGLSIVRRAADLLGHRVNVATRVGRGSCFSIEVPVKPVEPPAQIATPLPEHRAGRQPGIVLLVEDDPLVASAMQYALRDLGAQVIYANSGDQAASMAGDLLDRPDLVIADFRLPGSHNGVETILKLRTRFGPGLHACLITGDQDPSIAEQARTIGVDFLRKPIRQEDLQRLVSAAQRAVA